MEEGRDPSASALRVVLLYASPEVLLWMERLRERLERTEGVEIVARLWIDRGARESVSPLFRWFREFDRRHRQKVAHPLASRDFSDRLKRVALNPAGSCAAPDRLEVESGKGSPKGAGALDALGAQVFLWLGSPAELGPLADSVAETAPFGLWAVQHGECASVAAWTEFASRQSVFASRLLVFGGEDRDVDGPRRFELGVTRLEKASLHRCASMAACKTVEWLERALLKVRDGGLGALEAGAARPAGGRPGSAPNTLSMLQLVPRLALHKLATRHRSRTFHEQWVLATRSHEEGRSPWQEPERYEPILPPSDRIWVDPFLFRHRGRSYAFFEDYSYAEERGRISWLDLDAVDAEPGSALECDTHLSYPFVFERDGDIWMMPESLALRRVELPRATRFPDRWTREAVLHAAEGLRRRAAPAAQGDRDLGRRRRFRTSGVTRAARRTQVGRSAIRHTPRLFSA